SRHFRSQYTVVYGIENLAQNSVEVVAHRPSGIMRLEPADITDPPDVITGTVGLAIGPLQLAASQALAFLDRLEHRAVAVTPAADVVHLAGTRNLEEMPERIHQV